MKTWKEIKSKYIQYLLALDLKQPERRISALNKIEDYFKATYPSMLKGYTLFSQIDKSTLKVNISNWKGQKLNGAENQVINDFYKLAGNS